MSNYGVLVFDVETGGVNPFTNGLASVTLKVKGLDIIDTFYVKVNDRLRYEQGAFNVNGLDRDYLNTNGVTEREAIERVVGFIKRNYPGKPNILGHNVVFDVQFMNALFMRNGSGMFTDFVYYHPKDTMILLDGLRSAGLVNLRSVSLVNAYKHFFGKDFDNAHNSEADVIATEELYDKIISYLSSSCLEEVDNNTH